MTSFWSILAAGTLLIACPILAGPLLISNSQGFETNPIVDSSGLLLDGFSDVTIAVGTFESQPQVNISGSGETFSRSTYEDLLLEFNQFGGSISLVEPAPPLNLMGVFQFQETLPVIGSGVAGGSVYVLVMKGGSMAAASEVAILRADTVFNPTRDDFPLPTRIGIGTSFGSEVIVGSESRFTSAATGADPTLQAAYSLATLVEDPEIAVEQPAGIEIPDGSGSVHFGSVAPGSPADLVFTIRNSGLGPLMLPSTPAVDIIGPDASEFSITVPPLSAVPAGGTTTFTVRYSPNLAENATATLFIFNNDPDEDPYQITLTGTKAGPEITILDFADSSLTSGLSSIDLGESVPGTYGDSATITIRNDGLSNLTGLAFTFSGTDAGSFGGNFAGTATTLAPAEETSLTLFFFPQTEGNLNGILEIASNDADENPFTITLTGLSLSTGIDSDGDGLNDASEFLLSALGFDWETSQPGLVEVLFENAENAGLLTPSQIQALDPETPLVPLDPSSNSFRVRIDWRESMDLEEFSDFAASASHLSVDPSGDIRLEIADPPEARFYKFGVSPGP